MFREHLTCFSNIKSNTFLTLELIHQVGGLAVSKTSDGTRKVVVRANERLGGDVDGACLPHLPTHSFTSSNTNLS